jgi:hypothetical protein
MEVAASIPPLRSFIAADLIFGVTIVAILIGLAIWGVGRVLSSRTVAATLPSAPSISEVLASTPEPTLGQEVTFIPAADTPIASTGTQGTTGEIPTPGLNANVQVNVFAVERAFVRVAVDGEVVFDGRVLPGESYLYEAEDQVSILTGNAAALRITYNGRDLGLMGNFGQVVSQIYTITGLATPTATIPPTPTDTPLVTLTPTATTTPTVMPTLEISTP